MCNYARGNINLTLCGEGKPKVKEEAECIKWDTLRIRGRGPAGATTVALAPHLLNTKTPPHLVQSRITSSINEYSLCRHNTDTRKC